MPKLLGIRTFGATIALLLISRLSRPLWTENSSPLDKCSVCSSLPCFLFPSCPSFDNSVLLASPYYQTVAMFFLPLLALLTSSAPALCAPLSSRASAPTATVKNGTLAGVYSAEYDQDFFLGVPFAQPPVGDLRFVNPQSLNSTFSGTQDASSYSPECYGYGVSGIHGLQKTESTDIEFRAINGATISRK